MLWYFISCSPFFLFGVQILDLQQQRGRQRLVELSQVNGNRLIAQIRSKNVAFIARQVSIKET